jgi:ribonuclease P protein component
MLAKEKRLNVKKEFTRVAGGKKIDHPFVKLFFIIEGQNIPKIGLALSGNYFKKAVDRNKAKRVISTGFEKLYQQIVPGAKIIAMPKTEVLKLNSGEILSNLEKLLKQNKLLNEKTDCKID